jgi:outer membrane protein assembly factor BamB
VDAQPAVNPSPGDPTPTRTTSDGGIITSSAWFEPQSGTRPPLVIFAGGFTLYALDASSGKQFWKHRYPGRPELPEADPLNDPTQDQTRIFSSPAVVGRQVLFGVTADGQDHRRGYFQSADLATGAPLWRFETDTQLADGSPANDGCGGVWSSPTVDASDSLVVFDVADCKFRGTPPFSERVIALHHDGTLGWVFTPPRLRGVPAGNDPDCDWDFGATANYGALPDGKAFLGVGSKDGTYYGIDPATGRDFWPHSAPNVVFGGFAGGFIATTAFDGRRAYGATALGDFGRFEGVGSLGCEPGNPRDQPVQEPSMHAFDAAHGTVAWQAEQSQSFGPTTVAGGMTFVGTGISRQVQIRDASTGRLLDVIPLPAPSDSGVSVVGNSIYFGTGSSEQVAPAGVYAFSPLGGAPAP